MYFEINKFRNEYDMRYKLHFIYSKTNIDKFAVASIWRIQIFYSVNIKIISRL